jgi:hypothetical protein
MQKIMALLLLLPPDQHLEYLFSEKHMLSGLAAAEGTAVANVTREIGGETNDFRVESSE